MNPLKCAFGVTQGKFLGFTVHRQGIDLDPSKARAVLDMPPPTSVKQLKSFLGKISYLRRFLPALSEATFAFSTLLKGNPQFTWTSTHQKAFETIKQALTSPQMMYPPRPSTPLLLYLTSTERSIGALLAQDLDGCERPIYYLSRLIRDVETRYSHIERHCLALVFAAQKFRHYFLAHQIRLITKCDPYRHLLTKPLITGKTARWLLALTEFDITCCTPRAIKSQALADLLAQFPTEQHEPIEDILPLDELQVATAEEQQEEWQLAFDGSSTATGGGAGIVLTSAGRHRTATFKLQFKCSNNEAEYEALILGLLTARERGISRICINGDSKLVIKQTSGDFAIREPALASYRTMIQKLLAKFDTVRIAHVPRSNNRYPDALATLASKIHIEGDETHIKITQRQHPTVISQILPVEPDETDWRTPIIAELTHFKGSIPLTQLGHYQIIQGFFYHKLPCGALARCLGPRKAQQVLHRSHQQHCSADIALYRRLQRQGYYWPEMAKEANALQQNCRNCQASPDPSEAYIIEEGDWRLPYIAFLTHGTLPSERAMAVRLKKRAQRFFLRDSTLFRTSLNGHALRCLGKEEANEALTTAHSLEHQGGKKLFALLLHQGYYWPSMATDAKQHVQKCSACQLHDHLIHTPATPLHPVSTPWPFHTWGLDLIGPVRPAVRGYTWILVATEYCTKWVEAIPLKKATGQAVSNFIREYLIYRYGIPQQMITDNGTPFINRHVKALLEEYNVTHRRSTSYYPKGNGQAEASNKALLKILSRTLEERASNWVDLLPMALWAHRTSKKRSTGQSPFSLVYGIEAILPFDIAVPSAQLAARS